MKKSYANGVIYEGELNSSQEPHGMGKKTYPNGDFYEGEWKNGRLSGHGICVMGKERYNGMFLNDCFDGDGTYKYENGASYSGAWSADRWNGEGILTLADGTKIECEWKMGKIPADVSIIYADGSVYNGKLAPISASEEKDYISGKINLSGWQGQGTYTRADGSELSGEWSGYMHGESITIKSSDGRVAVGKIAGGELVESRAPKSTTVDLDKLFSHASLSAPKADEYDGETNRRGEYHGSGVLRYQSGEVYSGGFAYGNWYGTGLYVTSEGVTFFGYFTSTKESSNISLLDGIKVPVHGKMRGGKFIPDAND